MQKHRYIGQMRGTVTIWDFGVTHLVVWVKLAAVHIVVMTPEHSRQLPCVEGIYGN